MRDEEQQKKNCAIEDCIACRNKKKTDSIHIQIQTKFSVSTREEEKTHHQQQQKINCLEDHFSATLPICFVRK